MNEYPIYPYLGVGPLKFGMLRTEAHNILGAPDRQKKSRFSNEVTDYWQENGLQLVFSEQNDRLEEISLYSNLTNVNLNEVQIFRQPRKLVYEALCKLDGEPRQAVGIIIFLKLGIAIAGFLNDDADDQSVTAFSIGRWSKDDPTLKPI